MTKKQAGPPPMKFRAKIVRQGNTLCITVTKPVRELGLDLGDYVDVTLEKIKD